MFLHKFDILNRNQNGLFQKLLPVCDEIMRRDEIRWFDGTYGTWQVGTGTVPTFSCLPIPLRKNKL